MKTLFAVFIFAGIALLSIGEGEATWFGLKTMALGLFGEACVWWLP